MFLNLTNATLDGYDSQLRTNRSFRPKSIAVIPGCSRGPELVKDGRGQEHGRSAHAALLNQREVNSGGC